MKAVSKFSWIYQQKLKNEKKKKIIPVFLSSPKGNNNSIEILCHPKKSLSINSHGDIRIETRRENINEICPEGSMLLLNVQPG